MNSHEVKRDMHKVAQEMLSWPRWYLRLYVWWGWHFRKHHWTTEVLRETGWFDQFVEERKG